MQACRSLPLIWALASTNLALAESADRLSEANAQFMLGNYSEALNLYDEIGRDKSQPHAEDSQYLAARCLHRLNDLEQAQNRLKTFLAEYPQSRWADDALMDLAAIETSDSIHQNLHVAASRYEDLLSRYPDGNRVEDALVELGNTYVKLEEWANAERTFYQLLSHATTDEEEVRARLLIAALFSADNNPAQDLPRALSEYEHQILNRFPKSRQLPAAYFGDAEVKRKLQEYDGAVTSYSTLVERWPHHALTSLAQSRITYCQEQKGQMASAHKEPEPVKSLTTAEESAPTSPRTSPGDQKDQIQILSNTSQKSSEAVTEFSGDVSVFYADVQIETQQASYDAETRLITAEGPATIQAPGQKLTTKGALKLDVEAGVIEVPSDSQVDPPATIPTCTSSRLHWHLGSATLTCAP